MRMTPKQKTEAVARAIAIRAERGTSWATIAKEVGVSTTWLIGRVGGHVTAPLAGAITPEMVEAAKLHRESGATWKVTARRVGAGNAKRLADTCNGSIKKAGKNYARLESVTQLVTDKAIKVAIGPYSFGIDEIRKDVGRWLLQRQADYAISHTATHVLRTLGLIGQNSRDLTKKGRVYLWLAFK